MHTHIAKTGGSTLARALEDLAGGHSLDLRGRKINVRALDQAERDRLRVVTGHLFYGTHDRFRQDVLYVAAVRDPVAREVSRYRFLQTQPDHPAHPVVADKPFEEAWEALCAFRGTDRMTNSQCQQLTGRSNPNRLRRWEVQRRLRKDYFLVIPVERMTRAIAALYRAFGRAAPADLRENVSTAPPVNVRPAVEQKIREMNALDDWMVGLAGRLFPDRLTTAMDRLAQT